jgi:hypothetical protein
VWQQLRDDPRVREVEPVLGARRLTCAVPDDFFFPRQWHLLNTGQNGGTAGQDINVVGVWGDFGVTGRRGAGVRLGIVDDGLESGHPDLAADAMTGRRPTSLAGRFAMMPIHFLKRTIMGRRWQASRRRGGTTDWACAGSLRRRN